MSETSKELTIEELRHRIEVAGVSIPEARLEMVKKLLGDALRPIRGTDWRAANLLEPAVTFDAAPAATQTQGGDHGRR
jgi:hypothetical protein